MDTSSTHIRALERHDANQILANAGLSIGDWANITYADEANRRKMRWERCKAPANAAHLIVFSQKLVEWVPNGNEYIIQFDNSTWFSADQLLMFEVLCDGAIKINHGGTCCINGGDNAFMTLLSLCYFFLLAI